MKTEDKLYAVKWRAHERMVRLGLKRCENVLPAGNCNDAESVTGNPPCCGCGGPHPFDTVVPSVRWNAVIRKAGLPEYLCLTCIVKAFVLADASFTATLWGGFFNGMAIEVRVNEQPAIDAAAVSNENTELRAALNQPRDSQKDAR